MSQPKVPMPAPCLVQADNIPAEMKARAQWVNWRWEWKPPTANAAGKWDKPPYDPKTGRHAKSNDPATWSSFEIAWAACRDPANGYSGIGYVFSGGPDDFVGVDLDDCRDLLTGEIRAWTEQQRACEHWSADAPEPIAIIESVRSYAEVSPSGSGVKLILRGELNGGMKHGDIEMYSSGRYFTVTGQRLPECPAEIARFEDLRRLQQLFSAKPARPNRQGDHQKKPTKAPAAPSKLPTVDQVIAACTNASNGAKFSRLFDRGDTSEYANGTEGRSEADSALCCMLAFFACGDPGLIDKVFRQSKLLRDKWDEARGAQTYGQRTIDNALTVVTEYYNWSRLLGDGQAKLIGDIRLVPKSSKRTASKIAVQIEVQKDGEPIDLVKLTDSASNRKAVLKSLVSRVGADADTSRAIDDALAKILVEAASRSGPTACTGTTVYDLLAEYVPGEIELQYATEGGKAFSAKLGKPISRAIFLERFTSNHVLKLASTATDAPRDDNDNVLRQALSNLVERELKLLWGELYSELGTVDEVELDDMSPTAVALRQAIVTLWTRPASMGIHKMVIQKGDSVQLATRNSLALRVQKLQDNGVQPGRWHAVQEGFHAYMRLEKGPEPGEFAVVLGMRYELAQQIGVTIPDVDNQTALTRLGVKFGAVSEDPVVFGKKIPSRMSGGQFLAVLSPRLTGVILATPLEASDEPSEERPCSEKPASERLNGDHSSVSETRSDDFASLEQNLNERDGHA